MENKKIINLNIILCLIMSVYCMYLALTRLIIVYITCATLWAFIGILHCTYNKIIREKDELIDSQRRLLLKKIGENIELRREIYNLKDK